MHRSSILYFSRMAFLFVLSISSLVAEESKVTERRLKEIDYYSKELAKLEKQCSDSRYKEDQYKCPGPHDEKLYRATGNYASKYAIAKEALRKLTFEDNKIKNAGKQIEANLECEANGFKTCYKGTNWGASVDLICSEDIMETLSDFKRLTVSNYHDNADCDSFIKSNLPKRKENCVHGNCSLAFAVGTKIDNKNDCFAITINDKLTGFYKYWPLQNKEKITEDQFYFLLSQLKKKYGKDVEKSKCGGIETYSWMDTPSGLNILLFKGVNKFDGKLNLFLRYLHKDTFAFFTSKQKEIDSINRENKKQEYENKLESIGSGI